MDLSGSRVSSLVRPRVAVAFVTAAAALSIGFGLYYAHQRREQQDASGTDEQGHVGGGLHRRNAVRRRRHSHADGPNGADRQAANDDDTAAVPATDENADVNNVRPSQGDGGRAETIADDGTVDERWLDDMTQAVVQRAGQNIVSLLFRVSEDNARRSAYVHRGCACNACGIVPIRGIRYRCANCADFDLCETCESQGLHIKTHIFYKVKVPAPPFGPRQMQPVWYPGDPDACLRSLPRSLIHRLSRETGFERQELEAFWEQWTYMANTEWRDDPDDLCLAMDRKTFERCLVPSGGYRHAAPNLIHDRMFAFYDTNNDDLIGFSEFLHGLSYRKRKDKLRKIFDGYDTDRDGLVNRRDFLRFFRAYYVLYKQMHKDILEGLDDQVMSSIETHQLVANRQPLSSLFGREGRVPQADLRRMLHGKTVNNATGEVTVTAGGSGGGGGGGGGGTDGSGVVNEDKTDTANREEILSRLFTNRADSRRHSGLFSAVLTHGMDDNDNDNEGNSAQTHYWEALLNPPMSVQDLPALLVGGRRDSAVLSDGIFVSNDDESMADADELQWSTDDVLTEYTVGGGSVPDGAQTSAAAAEDAGISDATADAANAASSSEHQDNGETQQQGMNGSASVEPTVAPLDEQQQGSGSGSGSGGGRIRFNNRRLPTIGQLRAQQEAFMRAQMSKKAKVSARRKLHDRWKRRQFYLDEEEGAAAPDGWLEDEDVLASVAANEVGQGQSSGQHGGRPSASQPRSRSSSKVRFVEDTEDYEIRSNPSTSSRSVPERWGGMEIPDAERDAGREILYQVMQQAFNELLDILFLHKENLAVAAAETKAQRDKFRHLFELIDVADVAAEAAKSKRSSPTGNKQPLSTNSNKPINEQSLEELLHESGYEIIGTQDAEQEGGTGAENHNDNNNDNDNDNNNSNNNTVGENENRDGRQESNIGTHQEAENGAASGQTDAARVWRYIYLDETAPEYSAHTQVRPPRRASDVTVFAESPECLDHYYVFATYVEPEHRDPTMPQYLPNSDADLVHAPAQAEASSEVAGAGAEARGDHAAQAETEEAARVHARARAAAALASASTAATVATSSDGEGQTSPTGGALTPPVAVSSSAAEATNVDNSNNDDNMETNSQLPSQTEEESRHSEEPPAIHSSSSSQNDTHAPPATEEEAPPPQQHTQKKLKEKEPQQQRSRDRVGERGRNGDGTDTPASIDRATLVEWKRLDLAEQEAKARGGWGKLSYEEFEVIFKEEEASSNRLDYLGSWIDFCIP